MVQENKTHELACDFVTSELTQGAMCFINTISHCKKDILSAAQLVVDAMRSGHKVLLCGNGGSAALCQHLASEFINGLVPRDVALPAIALTTDTSVLTAQANDYDFSRVFVPQIEALGKEGDILIAISTSGESENVERGASFARAMGLKVIGLTSCGDDSLNLVCHVAIQIPSWGTQHIQEAHLAIGHILVALVEREIFGEELCES